MREFPGLALVLCARPSAGGRACGEIGWEVIKTAITVINSVVEKCELNSDCCRLGIGRGLPVTVHVLLFEKSDCNIVLHHYFLSCDILGIILREAFATQKNLYEIISFFTNICNFCCIDVIKEKLLMSSTRSI